jgi:dipeptidase E
MRLVLYSGGYSEENQALASEVGELLRRHRSPRISFIPGCSIDAEDDFREFQECLAGVAGRKQFQCIPVDQALPAQQEAKLFSSDAIFIGGGNTFYILHHLKKRRLLAKLRAFVREEGVLMGLSAGSILMTPNVMTAKVPALDCDDNEVGLKDLRALALVPFEFSPHYRSHRKADAELLAYSRTVAHPIYACADGAGIVVRENALRFVGRVVVFHGGFRYLMQ